jgi:hypothetical protein
MRVLNRILATLSLMLVVFYLIGFSQQPFKERPYWTRSVPKGYLNDYFIGLGTSSISEADAHKQALEKAIESIIKVNGFTVSSSVRDTTVVTQITQNDFSNFELVKKTVTELSIDGKSTTVSGLREEENYFESDGKYFNVWSLIKIPKKTSIESPPNSFSPVWRSVLLPGWGQFFKGQNTKGFLIAGAEVALIPSAFIFNNLKLTAKANAENSRTQALRDYYNDQTNLYEDISLGCFIVAGAIYIFNIFDAISSEGEKVYVDNNKIKFEFYSGYTTRSSKVTLSIRI